MIQTVNGSFRLELNKCYGSGGRVRLGNIHKRNSNQDFQDNVPGWRLVHRDEADMNCLLRASAFQQECSRMLFEDAGIHFFS